MQTKQCAIVQLCCKITKDRCNQSIHTSNFSMISSATINSIQKQQKKSLKYVFHVLQSHVIMPLF